MRRIANPKKSSLEGQTVVLTKQRITDPQTATHVPTTNGNSQPPRNGGLKGDTG